MRVRSVVAGAAAACGLVAASTMGAAANIMWCGGDPPAQVTSPSGTQFTVNATIYASSSRQHLSQQPFTQVVTSAPDGSGGTLVTVEVLGPANQYVTVVATVHKGSGAISAQNSGSGDIVVVLDVPIA